MDFDEIWQDERSSSPLVSLYFSGQLKNQEGHPGLWDILYFFRATAEPNLMKLDRKQEI